MMNRVLGQTVALFFLFQGMLAANTEHIIPPSYSAISPYLVVVEDGHGYSKKRPGLYVRGRRGEGWRKIMGGNFDFNYLDGAYLEQLEVATSTKKSETLAIVDGKITLFNLDSSEKKAGSIVRLGEDVLLRDVSNYTHLRLPPIRDREHVAIYAADRNSPLDGQTVLVSLKDENHTIGDGLTFSFRINVPSKGEKSLDISDVILLAHRYYPRNELSKFILENGRYVALPTVATQLAAQLEDEKAGVLQNEKMLLQKFVKKLNTLSRPMEKPLDQGPYWDWTEKKVRVPKIAPERIGPPHTNLKIFQQYSFKGDGMVFASRTLDGNAPPVFKLVGRMDLMENNAPGVIGPIYYHWPTWIHKNNISSSVAVQLFVIDGEVYLLFDEALIKVYGSVGNLVGGSKIKEASFQEIRRKVKVDDDRQDFILSIKTEKSEFTELISLKKTGEDGYSIRDRYQLSNNYYLVDELKNRIKEKTEGVYFDYMTPPQESDVAYQLVYEEQYKAEFPHISLTKSNGRKLRKALLEPDSSHQIGRFTYRRYPKVSDSTMVESAMAEGTGLYVKNRHQLAGQLLPANLKGKLQEDRYYWYRRTFVSPLGNQVFTMNGLMVDPSFLDGEKGARLYAAISTMGEESIVNGEDLGIVLKDTSLTFTPERIKFFDVIFTPSGDEKTGEFGLFAELVVHYVVPALDNRPKKYMLAVSPLRLEIKGEGKVGSKKYTLAASSPGIRKIQVAGEMTRKDFRDRLLLNRLSSRDNDDNYLLDNNNKGQDIYLRISGEKGEDNFTVIDWSKDGGAFSSPIRPYGVDRVKKRWGLVPFVENLHDENSQGDEYQREVDRKELEKNWNISSINMKNILAEEKKGAIDSRVFPGLVDLLNDLANPKKRPRHVVLIVPPELKPHIGETIVSLWEKGRSLFGDKNQSLKTYFLRKKMRGSAIFQRDLMSYLSLLASSNEQKEGQRYRSLLLADVNEVNSLGRPEIDSIKREKGEVGFKLNLHLDDPEDASDRVMELVGRQDNKEMTNPHALYLMATEGKEVNLSDFSQERMGDPKYSQLIIASESDWNNLIGENAKVSEAVYGLDKHFERFDLTGPSLDMKVQMMESIFSEPAVKALGLGFDLKGIIRRQRGEGEELPQLKQRDQIIRFFVTILQRFAENEKMVPILAFSRGMTVFRESLFSDQQLRKTKTVNRAFLERIVPKIFKVPLKLEALPKSHWLAKLYAPDFLKKVREVGQYNEGNKLFSEIREDHKALMRPLSGRKSAASFLLYGKSETGKTYTVEAFMKTLGIEVFKDQTLNAENTGAFVFDGKELGSGEAWIKAMADFRYFLVTSLHANESHVVFDDLHKASPPVRKEMVQLINELIDNNSGTYDVKHGRERKAVPTRNIVTWVLLNPVEEKRTVQGEIIKIDDPEEGILEAIRGGEISIADKSFLTRFSRIIPYGSFSDKARASGLANKFKDLARDNFYEGRYIAITPSLIINAAKRFGKLGGRKFLSGAISGIVKKLEQERGWGEEQDAMRILVASGELGGLSLREQIESSATTLSGSDEEGLRDYLVKSSSSLSITESLEGRLKFVELMANNFRRQIFYGLAEGLRYSPPFNGEEELYDYQLKYLPWIERAFQDHIEEHPILSLSLLNLDPYGFDRKGVREIQEFKDTINRLGGEEKGEQHFPQSMFEDGWERKDILRSLTDVNFYSDKGGNTPWSVLNSQFSLEIGQLLARELADRLAVKDLASLVSEAPDYDVWVEKNFKKYISKESFVVGREMVAKTMDYVAQMAMRDIDDIKGGQRKSVNLYEAMRFWSLVIDRALSRLPWEQVSSFLSDMILDVSGNLALSNRPEVSHYFFESNKSLIQPAVTELGEVLPESEEDGPFKLTEETVAKNQKSFLDCKGLLKK